MSDEPQQDPQNEQALAVVVGEQLARRPVIELVNQQQLALIRNRVAPNATDGELGQFLELCVSYSLDPYAGEAWCAKGKGKNGNEGRLLIMVGRDGLRKIAHRNGLDMDGDVVRAKDTFKVRRDPKTRQRTIEHEYEETGEPDEGQASSRGPIIGAWVEVYDGDGKQRGYFYAPLSEYRPSGAKLEYSPWGSQESVMILAAAERQSLRQATPLGGLLAEGEDARVGEGPQIAPAALDAIVANFVDDEQSAAAVVALIERARAVGHAGLSDVATVEMTLSGQSQEFVDQWLHDSVVEVERVEAAAEEEAGTESEEEVQDAVVVEDGPGEGDPVDPEAQAKIDAEDADGDAEDERDPAAVLDDRAAELRLEADAIQTEGAEGCEERAAELREQADEVESEAAELRIAAANSEG